MSHTMTDGIPEGWRAENGMHVITSLHDPVLQKIIAFDGKVIELFAGPGGASLGMELAGINPRSCLGIEWDASACMTATKAGHPRLWADIALLNPRLFGKIWGFHGSPPCQGFSMAGKGESRGDTDLLLNAIWRMGMNPERVDEIMADLRGRVKSPLSPLSLEPLRWILALRPAWFTLEQVAAVLPLWEAYAEVLGAHGYSVWTGIVNSEQYGVPQTRRRAVAIGSRERVVSAPKPTHSRFYTHKSKRGQLDPGVLPYVTMAQALGWGMTSRPYVTVAAGTKSGGTDPQVLGGSSARKIVRTELEDGRWATQPAGHPRARALNSDDPPQERDVEMDNGNFQWVTDPDAMREQLASHPERVNNQSGTDFDLSWPAEQPAPAVAGRGLVGMPGANANRFNGSTKSRNDGVRVTVQEAGILQSFPADYPWTGTLTKQYEQAGNAVPPLLEKALVETVLGLREEA